MAVLSDSVKRNSAQPLTTVIKTAIKTHLLFGNRPSLELAAILLVYFVQGILGLAQLAVSFFLKDDLGLSPTQVAALLGIVSIPWIVKPLFGFLSDGFPIFGYRRRPYLVLSGLLGAVSWGLLATVVHTAIAATVFITLSSASIALSDVIVDSLVVERARRESQAVAGSLQSLCWGTAALGGLFTAYFSGSLLEEFSSQTVFLITASFPLVVSCVAGLIAEEKVEAEQGLAVVREQVSLLRQAVSQRAIWMPAAFIFLWQATPSSDSAFFFFSTNDLGFSAEFLGRLRLVTSAAAIAGIWLFQRFFKKVPFRTIFRWTILISAALGLTSLLLVTHANRTLGLEDHWFSLGDSLVLTVMGEIAYMPILVLAARICPPGVEATLFALLMSVLNLARLVSHEGGALLTKVLGITEASFEHMWVLVLIANVSTLLPLLFLRLLPDDNIDTAADSAANGPLMAIAPATGHEAVPAATSVSHQTYAPAPAMHPASEPIVN
ncbi:MAG: folate/biopterin family MFS transporter [Elainellaceae cyanobacterium]